jgi:hypothetical protein
MTYVPKMSLVTTLKYELYHLLPMFHVHTQIVINLSIVLFVALEFYNSAVHRNKLQKKIQYRFKINVFMLIST